MMVFPLPRMIFFHVPKCAGTSVEVALERVYGSGRVKYPATVLDYLVTPPQMLEGVPVLAGHITHSTAQPYLFSHPLKITLLRDPVRRLRSAYNYFRSLADGTVLNRTALRLDFRCWLNCGEPEVLVQIQNAVIRQFTPETYWQVERAACPEVIMSVARQFLASFDLIGWQEDLPAFQARLALLLGVAPGQFALQIHNRSGADFTRDVTDDEVRHWMGQHSSLDLQLHDWLRSREDLGLTLER